MTIDLKSAPRWDWSAVDRPGCVGVEARVLFAGPALTVVSLRFATSATIDPHAAAHHIDVVCLEGSGHVQVGSETGRLTEGQTVRWPAGVSHRLWTDDSAMTTLMLEHVGPGSGL